MANRGERDRAVATGNNQVSHVLHQGMGYLQAMFCLVIPVEAIVRGAIGARDLAIPPARNGKAAV